MLFIYNICKNNKSNISPSLSREFICVSCGINKNSIKTVIDRLISSKLLIRNFYRTSKHGGTEYSIPEIIYNEILLLETKGNLFVEAKITQLNNFASGTNEPTKEHTTHSVVSSYINTTTNISNEFSSIDCSPLAEIGFTESHIIQICREYEKNPQLALHANIIQDSINALSFDLKHNRVADSFKHSPAVVLISLLKKGVPYSCKTPEKFKTPQQEAWDKYTAAQEIIRKNEEASKAKAKQLEFEKWRDSLEEEKLLSLCAKDEVKDIPQNIRKTMQKKKAKERLGDYFDAEIWPTLRIEIEKEINNAKEQEEMKN